MENTEIKQSDEYELELGGENKYSSNSHNFILIESKSLIIFLIVKQGDIFMLIVNLNDLLLMKSVFVGKYIQNNSHESILMTSDENSDSIFIYSQRQKLIFEFHCDFENMEFTEKSKIDLNDISKHIKNAFILADLNAIVFGIEENDYGGPGIAIDNETTKSILFYDWNSKLTIGISYMDGMCCTQYNHKDNHWIFIGGKLGLMVVDLLTFKGIREKNLGYSTFTCIDLFKDEDWLILADSLNTVSIYKIDLEEIIKNSECYLQRLKEVKFGYFCSVSHLNFLNKSTFYFHNSSQFIICINETMKNKFSNFKEITDVKYSKSHQSFIALDSSLGKVKVLKLEIGK